MANFPELPSLRRSVSAAVLALVTGVWTYQMLTPDVGVDPGLYSVVLLLAIGASITLMGEGTITAAVGVLEELTGGEPEAAAEGGEDDG